MINGRVYINLGVVGTVGILVDLPLDVLLVIGESNVEIKGFVPLIKAQAYEGVLTPAILDPENEVPGGIEDGLDGDLALAGVDKAGGEEVTRIGILEADLTAGMAGDDAETTGPDLVGLEPVAALVAAAGGAGRDLEDGDLADHQEGVLEGLVVVVERGGHRRMRGIYLQGFV